MSESNILFLCTGNSCRSQMAEGIGRYLAEHLPVLEGANLNFYSAGIEAHGINPTALKVMGESGIDISQQTSDILDTNQLAAMDWVITLCDHACEHCPPIPENVKVRHWCLDDPAGLSGSEAEVLLGFRAIRDEIRRRIQHWLIRLVAGEGTVERPLGQQDYELLDRKVSFKGFFALHTLKLKHKLYQGGWMSTFTREVFDRSEAVVVLPYDPVTDQVVLIEQFRAGAIDTEQNPWLLELVAGMVEPGESYEQVAHREAMEEAGCELQALIPISHYLVSPGGTNEKVALYCAKVDASGLGGYHGLDYEHEDIRVLVVETDVAFAMMQTGEINNAATLMALQWLQLNKGQLV